MNEEKTMPGFMTYREVALMFTLMPKDEAADVIQAACRYYLYGEVTELHGVAAEALRIEMASIDRGREKYKSQVEGGKKGAGTRYGKEYS